MKIPVNSRGITGKQKEVKIVLNDCRISGSLVLWLFLVGIGSPAAVAQASLKAIDNPQGGRIVYGPMEGATTQAAAMSQVLRMVHTSCGERPLIGKVFRVRGTNSDAVFFTVVNHALGNKARAGLLIASTAGPNGIEVGAVIDDSARFGSTVNPMLKQLFSEWHPGGAGQASAPTPGAGSAIGAALHPVVLPDHSATVALPDGWKVAPSSAGGTIVAFGPRGEIANLGWTISVVDSNNYSARQTRATAMQYGRGGSNQILYPYTADPARAFPDLMNMFLRNHGSQTPATFQITSSTPVSNPGKRCAHLTGHVDQHDGKGVMELNSAFCADQPAPMGDYLAVAKFTLVPTALADEERATLNAILASYNRDRDVVDRQAHAYAAPRIATIDAIGRADANRRARSNAANDAQHAGYWAQQDSNARHSQAFSNYQLDQTVIQDNNMYGNGTVSHGTAWNSTADALVRSDPNRFEYVSTPNYWRGVDY